MPMRAAYQIKGGYCGRECVQLRLVSGQHVQVQVEIVGLRDKSMPFESHLPHVRLFPIFHEACFPTFPFVPLRDAI